ncbi:nitrogen permease regulator of amino acid transport activity 3-domain-containing protein [Hygrophoropsis aurantiaca]|uniref:Nitrogen permease regulator of amino acid transport activity 3-domain-containing protein n=1 Tax=Hygrophoropsis aurantiaca TaxID=72124 RepID=A0ACB8AFQ0_9AGAM|nr:nitrogen permease regulator of amino acid transport activity 3-domain-containing protein [Hygrophoropsis aurantiaca]
MAETLLSILLVTSSAKGSSIVYRWPPRPESTSRLSRPKPTVDGFELDNPWRAANFSDIPNDPANKPNPADNHQHDETIDYEWKRPTTIRDRSTSFSRTVPLPTSGQSTPSKDAPYEHEDLEEDSLADEYNSLLNYSSQFLAGMLCPHRSLCHQKFELVIDDLAFVGHPVCVEADGTWRFKPEKRKPSSRGRGSRNRDSSLPDDERSEISINGDLAQSLPTQSLWLHTFHFVLVLDLPDPSSSASGNIARYFDTIYEQLAFTVTAVLFQEQVLSNFVEAECDALGSLKDEYIAKGQSFVDYLIHAQRISSIASATKILYEAVKSSTMAYITIHDIPLELQLPPYLDHLLHSDDEYDLVFVDRCEDEEVSRTWGRDLSFGWYLPALVPWKSLLLLDGEAMDPYLNLRGPHVRPDERTLAEGLIKFLETASVTLSLADMASLLDWDLETQVYPTVRWLVHHRRAKIVDMVHSSLKTIFTLAPKFETPLSKLSADFKLEFPQPFIPSLPALLATISSASSKQSDNHFFAAVVRSRELLPAYHEVVLWMLKRDLLYTLHLHIRIIATSELKLRVRQAHEHKLERSSTNQLRGRKRHIRSLSEEKEIQLNGEKHTTAAVAWLPLSPRGAHAYSQRLPSVDSSQSRQSDASESLDLGDDEDGFYDVSEEDSGEENIGWGTTEDTLWSTMIGDPGTATPLERRWLTAMSEGKDEYIARRFEQINRYFDGKRTDDEILYRAEISRKQLREVLHHYDEYLQTFLHSS